MSSGCGQSVGHVLVLRVPAEDQVVQPVGLKAVGHGHTELDRAELLEVEERAHPPGHQRVLDAAEAEGGLVVAVEDAAEQLEEKRQGRHPRRLAAFFDQPILAEELRQHVGTIDEGQVVVVDLVREAEPHAHLPELGLRPEGQGHQRQVGLGEGHVDVLAALLLAGLEAHLGPRIGIDLTEEGQLDLRGKK